MPSRAGLRRAFSGLLDAIAARLGLTLTISALLMMGLLAGLYVERSAQQAEESRQVFSDRHIRNGFMSMTDVQRLVLIFQQAKEHGGFRPETRSDFIAASDFLYARAQHFRQSLEGQVESDYAQEAVRSVDAVVEIADRAATATGDLSALWQEMLAANNEARRALTIFLEDMGRLQNEVMQDQARAVREQRLVVLASIFGMTVVGLASLLLLRREVTARNARIRAERHVEHLAYFDQLTDLPNRVQFHGYLTERLLRPEPVTLVLLDLDDFKGVNDTYGHAAGDAVLRHVAGLLSRLAAAAQGLAARLGGDEFAIALPTDDPGALTRTLAQLLQDARNGMSFKGEGLSIGLSIGYATSTRLGQGRPPSLDKFFRVVDFALYYSKSSGRGRFTEYDSALEGRFRERQSMVEELPHAITGGGLDIYLQPKVRIPGGTIYGFEALVRWNRGGQVVSPDEFIKVAEECGLIYDIDRHVMDVATGLLARFNRDHASDLSISVNLSALHFNSRRIVEWVREALATSGLGTGLLTVEITETAELRDWQEAQAVMADLRALGARIAIDDFGVGYSSLAYLRSKVVDEVKIDRSIVEMIETSDEARFLLDGVLSIAGNLGLEVVVEGVESRAQLEALEKMGSTRAQGFYFGEAVPADQALAALSKVTVAAPVAAVSG